MTAANDKMRELIDTGFFDELWYVERYPDVRRCGMSPAEHFVRIGQHIGRKPNGRSEGERSPVSTSHKSAESSSVPSKSSPLQDGSSYRSYQNKILATLNDISACSPLPTDVEVDADYTGPIHATPFDTFISPRQREDSINQTIKMLQLGVVAINPRPGVHAARQENGDFIRYRSLLAEMDVVERLPSSMLIHIHAFYPDVVEEMLTCFVGEAKSGRFLITTTTKKNYEDISRIADVMEFPNATIILIENKGRDIGPFLDYAVEHASAGETICHIHTKKSPDVGDSYGEKWRKSLYGALLNQTAVDAFKDDRLGLLIPDTSRAVGWGKNLPFCKLIADRIGCSLRTHPGPMPVGNMFFARVEVAQVMRYATQGMEWPREPVPYDGTVLHAIERMWTAACDKAGLEWAAIHVRYDDDDNVDRLLDARRKKRSKR